MFETVTVAGDKALEELIRYRALFRDSGQYPFLIGDSEALAQLSEQMEFDKRPLAEILAAASLFRAQEWLGERRAEMEADGCDFSAIEGVWPDEPPEQGRIQAHRDTPAGSTKETVLLGRVQIAEPWQLPAALHFGGWNDCPEPEIHAAMFMRWQEQYAAEIVSISGDVVECLVDRPPTERRSAIELAWEQYLFCYDIVEQGCQTIANLAAALLNSNYWHFWWD
ncbi:MAG: DUF4253 domain-containing protein [Pirellulaceae bacterium]|nr:DUF4253 domain-containing protein [Thermoguttaceae bacterium]MDI9446969.1 DUF4253 domain-containing protein [Planctomycetota bacterium]NLZ02905.1 DUF4253 domain-containing protein [Pirellulaceae bacterium]